MVKQTVDNASIKSSRIKTFLRNNILTFITIVVVIAIYFITRMFVQDVTVSGISMQPNLENNEKVLVFPYDTIHRYSVVVFNAHGQDPTATSKTDYYVKRVIGMPGDTVQFTNGKLYVNHKFISQNFISESEQTTGTQLMKYHLTNWDLKSLSKHWTSYQNTTVVPKGHYFVLGDHRSVSNDSRYWGYVNQDHILGVVKTLPWATSAKQRANINSYQNK